VKLALTMLLLLAAAPAFARDDPLPSSREPDDRETPAAPPILDLRATQVNRCADANGKVTFQGTPCFASPASAAGAAQDVVELSSLPPRPRADAPRAAPQDASTGGFTRNLVNGAWKLGLLVAACYVLVRAVRSALENYRDRHPIGEPGSGGRRRAR
jgi:hypothetical protein